MYTQPFWIEGNWPGRVAVSPRPRGSDWLEDEMKQWRQQGVDVVVSLLMPEEMEEFELQQEQRYCEESGMLFYSLSIIDRSVPNSIQDVWEVVGNLESELSAGKSVVVHCRQGIGRSGLIVIMLLMQKGQSFQGAIALVSKARGGDVPETLSNWRGCGRLPAGVLNSNRDSQEAHLERRPLQEQGRERAGRCVLK